MMHLCTLVIENGEEKIHIGTMTSTTPAHNENVTYTNIQYTSHVAKWLLRQRDPKYREFFVRRMKQLSRGERSRVIAKRLKGSKTTIFETYLDQKSGFRIIWTVEGNNLLV